MLRMHDWPILMKGSIRGRHTPSRAQRPSTGATFVIGHASTVASCIESVVVPWGDNGRGSGR